MVKYLLRRRAYFVAPEIPFDLMIEILTRLPAKSLMRFRCVSKLWSCLIRSRYFSNLYHTVSSSRPQPLGLYMSLNSVHWARHLKCDSMELCHNPGKSDLLSLRLSSSSSNSAESSLEIDLNFPGMEGHMMFVLRGLILYTICRKACIYNPATRQRLILPAVKSNIFAQQVPNKRVCNFFGHDPINDQYKILCIVVLNSKHRLTSEYWVFVVEPGGFWKRIEHDDDQPRFPTRQGPCINGVIYYLASSFTCQDKVYCFDVRFEEFRVIQVPSEVSKYAYSVGFIEHGGKPAIFDFTRIRETGVSELWVLEMNGGTWSRKSLVLKLCQKHLVDDVKIMDLRVHDTGQNNEVILALPNTCYLLYYDLIKNDLRKVDIKRESPPDQRLNIYVKLMDKGENIMPLEI
ncbi:putative F-box protein [Raphanus sativus]|uniref:F-box protein At5g62660 isoform X1 n=1 Tax=Raphanus sativus TaxID=3726 RepID=A0A9W3CII6_RAPSA|nr:putative F-box protein At5g62660 isoform X1 [Raphanus sativus]KAJ4877491.1 putative F-box protein [Raphanus sativus]